jgi:hypothetical protein
LFPHWTPSDWEPDLPFAHCGALGLSPCAAAIWLVGRLLWSAVASPSLKAQDHANCGLEWSDYNRDLRPAKWVSKVIFAQQQFQWPMSALYGGLNRSLQHRL